MRSRNVLAAGIAFALIIANANAATLQVTQGNVLVNRGAGYQATTGGQVNPGDTVMARQNGSAVIVYENGCTVEVGPGQAVPVATTPPCATGGVTTQQLVIGGVAVGAAIGIGVYLANKPASP